MRLTNAFSATRAMTGWLTLTVAIGVAALAGCVSTETLFLDPATGERSGKRLYERRCGECHTVYAPSAYTKAQWAPIVDEMSKLGGLDERDTQLILAHLVRNASDARPPVNASTMNGR